MVRKPTYSFDGTSSTGLDQVPLNGVILIENDGDGVDSPKLIYLYDTTGITSSTTVNTLLTTMDDQWGELGGGGGGAFDEVFIEVSANYSPSVGEFLLCSTSGTTLAEDATAYTITLPASPADKAILYLMDMSGNAQNRPVLVDRNTKNINGKAENLTIDLSFFDIKLVYESSTTSWAIGGI